MLEVDDRIPDAQIWLAPRESLSLHELVEEGPILVLFYLFDWSKSQSERRVALLGKAVTRGRLWWPTGLAMHWRTAPFLGSPSTRRAAGCRFRRSASHSAWALLEHVSLYPLSYLVDRYHPRARRGGHPAAPHEPSRLRAGNGTPRPVRRGPGTPRALVETWTKLGGR